MLTVLGSCVHEHPLEMHARPMSRSLRSSLHSLTEKSAIKAMNAMGREISISDCSALGRLRCGSAASTMAWNRTAWSMSATARATSSDRLR
jgi:hypothetical protein